MLNHEEGPLLVLAESLTTWRAADLARHLPVVLRRTRDRANFGRALLGGSLDSLLCQVDRLPVVLPHWAHHVLRGHVCIHSSAILGAEVE